MSIEELTQISNQIQDSIRWATWIGAVAAVLAAVLAAYLTMKQNQIVRDQSRIFDKQNEILNRQLRVDLFKERMAVYGAILDFIPKFTAGFNISQSATDDFNKLRRGAVFLFKDDVNEYMKKIFELAVDIHTENIEIETLRKAPPLPKDQEEARLKLIRKNGEDVKWMTKQTDEAKSHFRPYMDVSEII